MASKNGQSSVERLIKNLKRFETDIEYVPVIMTPEAALELQQHRHPNQRNVKKNKLNVYTQDARHNQWQETHEALAFDVDDKNIDGQNRLQACIDSGTPMKLMVALHVPKKALLAIDQGAMRNVSDVAKVIGMTGARASSNWAATARTMAYGVKGSKWISLSVQDIIAFMKAHDAAIEFAFQCMPKNIRNITQAPVRAVLGRAFYVPKTKHERVREFCEVLVTGLPRRINQDSAALRLRNWLLDSFREGTRKRYAGRRPDPSIVYGKTQAALRNFLDEKKTDILRETSEEVFLLPEEKE